MNEMETENVSPQKAFVDILLDIAREDKEFRDYLRGIVEQMPDDPEEISEAKEAEINESC